MYLHYKHADLAAKNLMLKCIFIIFLSQLEILLYMGLLFGVKGSKSNKNGHLSYIYIRGRVKSFRLLMYYTST